jgi:UDP-N-acetylmuramate: L-alanyl-gamma-D-glutamyl-meso-diaminopimelate ligase
MKEWPQPWSGHVHFIGVGGVAMSNLAALLAERDVSVTGSDHAVYPPASDVLERAGIEVRTPFAAEHLEPEPDLVVVGNAVSRGNEELEAALDRGFPLASLPGLLERWLVPGRAVSVVAGTHGKTTTASLLAWLHEAAGRDPSFFIGGLPGNFRFGARFGVGPDLVLEGDEYDTAFFDKGPKFLHYWPRVAVLGSIEFDHADIYADVAAVERSFALLLRLVPRDGVLVIPTDDRRVQTLAEHARCRILRFGPGPEPDFGFDEREDLPEGQELTLWHSGAPLGRAWLPLAGEHNARNACAALAAFAAAGGDPRAALGQLPGFRPPRRRLERVARRGGAELYDDFAHHPTAIRHTVEALRAATVRGGRVIACLEPRSNTMTRAVVQEALCEALAGADVAFVGPVHRPERYATGEALDVAALVAALGRLGVAARGPCSPEEIRDAVLAERRAGDRIVVMTNGSFGGLTAELRKALEEGEA